MTDTTTDLAEERARALEKIKGLYPGLYECMANTPILVLKPPPPRPPAALAPPPKPRWHPRNPMYALFSNDTLSEYCEKAEHSENRGADALDRHVDRAVASGMLPARHAKLLKKFTRALRQVERQLDRAFIDLNEDLHTLHCRAALPALERAIRVGKYDVSHRESEIREGAEEEVKL